MDSRISTGRPAATRRRRAGLIIEYCLLFVALPLAYLFDAVPLPLIPALWLMSVGCLIALLRAPGFDARLLWNADGLSRRLGRALLPVAAATPLLVGVTLLVAPDRLFGFVRARPLVWALVMVFYPILSVYPQGIIYRAFIFHRYRDLFPGRGALIAASAVAFSAVHVVFENWLAPVLTLAGGWLFARTYDRTRSSLVAAVQHAAFGCVIFTNGLGWFFYHGAVRGD